MPRTPHTRLGLKTMRAVPCSSKPVIRLSWTIHQRWSSAQSAQKRRSAYAKRTTVFVLEGGTLLRTRRAQRDLRVRSLPSGRLRDPNPKEKDLFERRSVSALAKPRGRPRGYLFKSSERWLSEQDDRVVLYKNTLDECTFNIFRAISQGREHRAMRRSLCGIHKVLFLLPAWLREPIKDVLSRRLKMIDRLYRVVNSEYLTCDFDVLTKSAHGKDDVLWLNPNRV